MPTQEPGNYPIRAYREVDRPAAGALGQPVVDWWNANGPDTFLHLVATTADTGEIVGHLQAHDCSVPEPSRRPGQCHFSLNIAVEHRRNGVGGALYERLKCFAQQRQSRLLYTAYVETPDAAAAPFLQKRGFEPLEWFHPSYLDLETFDPATHADALRRVEAQGIRLLTYAGVEDSLANRKRLYDLEQSARVSQPFVEVEPYLPTPFAEWEEEFAKRDQTTLFLAIASNDAWAGVVTGLVWYFTGVDPDWRGRGIATALKVKCLTEAKRRGLVRMETENHGHNAAMLAVNRKLGFIVTAPEVACVKRL